MQERPLRYLNLILATPHKRAFCVTARQPFLQPSPRRGAKHSTPGWRRPAPRRADLARSTTKNTVASMGSTEMIDANPVPARQVRGVRRGSKLPG